MIFAGLLTVVPGRYADGPVGHLSVAVAWGLVLWAVAAGVVMPVWLRFVGIAAPIPNLGVTALAGHLVWASRSRGELAGERVAGCARIGTGPT
jgi:hypothetical protein